MICICCKYKSCTTHVFIYRGERSAQRDVHRILIQLLFLFILNKNGTKNFLKTFQYNSCFYLSSCCRMDVSIHKLISIQLLFLFILNSAINNGSLANFNTTLVFIYPETCRYPIEKDGISIQLLFLFIQRISAIPYFHYSHFP